MPFTQANLLDGDATRRALEGVTGVVHLAGFKYAGVSVERPLHTYTQNVTAMVSLLEAMADQGVGNIVFSSSAGVYGTPKDEVVTEQTRPTRRARTARSKLIGEWLLKDQAKAVEPEATPRCATSTWSAPATRAVYDASPYNLFPIVCNLLTQGKVPQIYGTDHPTPDGTSVKDYVHVADLARAHVSAARILERGQDAGARLQPRQRNRYVGPRDHGCRPPRDRYRLHPDRRPAPSGRPVPRRRLR